MQSFSSNDEAVGILDLQFWPVSVSQQQQKGYQCVLKETV